MNKEIRLLFKIIWIMLGLLIIAYILAVSIRMNLKKQPAGECISLTDAVILMNAAGVSGQEAETGDKETLLNFGKMKSLLTIPENSAVSGSAGEDWLRQYLDILGEKYEDDFYILKEDFYNFYDGLLGAYGLTDVIRDVNLTILGTGGAIRDSEGNLFPQDRLLSTEGECQFLSPFFPDYPYQVIRAFKKEDQLLTVRSVVSRSFTQNNIWMMEANEKSVIVFAGGYEVTVPCEKSDSSMREQIADLYYADGILTQLKVKTEKVSGKLLSVKDGTVELEGAGIYPLEENARFYRLYGKLKESEQADLRIGYDFSDFVLEDGKICAGLLTREEAMENIRIVIKSTDFAGPYHEEVELTADTEFVLRYGSMDDRKEEVFQAGEILLVDTSSSYFNEGRIYVEPSVLTGKIKLLSVDRAQGTPSYRGKMEIAKTQEGLVIVNELLLEEYLYSVVPSEMPASYPLEALKAQAVCARTYAYRNMLRSGVAGFGAHVDDSAGYQVYNNIAENVETTKAVKETSGQLLYYGEELCGSYYYSTSCGFGTDVNIWKSDSKEDNSYLQALRIGENKEIYTGKNMTEEGTFENYITQEFEQDYESSEPWYRWTYSVDSIDKKEMLDIIKKRYDANSKLVLTKQEDGSFESKPVKSLGDILNITVEKRNAGGAADELIVEGNISTYKIISEHNIRYVLRNGGSKVVRKDGSEVAVSSLLPSAYMIVETKKDGDLVTGYQLVGGGYGHGVGMSQNGARSMADKGFDFDVILTYFYQSCQVKNIY